MAGFQECARSPTAHKAPNVELPFLPVVQPVGSHQQSLKAGPEVVGTEPGFEHGSLSIWPWQDQLHVCPQPGL